MKRIMTTLAFAIFFLSAFCQKAERKVTYTTGTVTTQHIAAMKNFPQGYAVCVDLNADEVIDQDYNWVSVTVETEEFGIVFCIVDAGLLSRSREAGKLYQGCKVQIALIKSGPRFGFPLEPRDHAHEAMPSTSKSEGFKGKVIGTIG